MFAVFWMGRLDPEFHRSDHVQGQARGHAWHGRNFLVAMGTRTPDNEGGGSAGWEPLSDVLKWLKRFGRPPEMCEFSGQKSSDADGTSCLMFRGPWELKRTSRSGPGPVTHAPTLVLI